MNAECVTTKDKIECVWQYSRYYGDMLFTSLRLYDSGEGYSATAILFNAVELIFKSFRENYEENFNQDIAALTEAGVLTADEKDFFDSPQYGIRKIRNIMTHREAYQYCLEDSNGKALPFVEADTWMLLYGNYSDRIIDIVYNALIRSNLIDI